MIYDDADGLYQGREDAQGRKNGFGELFYTTAAIFSIEAFGRMMREMVLARHSLKMAISRPKDIGGITAYLDGGHSTITLRWSLKVTL